MKFVIFGLTVSSSWGNGHATTWRGLLKALHRQGHQVTFFERDVPYYAQNRDLCAPDFCELVVYEDWQANLPRAKRDLAGADVAIVTSYCADGLAADRLMLDTPGPLHVFYDIDTPVTLADLDRYGLASERGARYLTAELVPEFDLHLSFTGGPVLDQLRSRWGAKSVAPLYCSVDPEVHRPAAAVDQFRSALGYLGTYSADRQASLERLLFRVALERPAERFVVAGAQYPPDVQWPANVTRWPHLVPSEHPAFYCSSRLTLNLTREAMIRTGYSPSVRLFEAASCGAPIISDWWPGLDELFAPGAEILVASDAADVHHALDLSEAELRAMGQAARQRTLVEHTCQVRAQQLVHACERAFEAKGLPASHPAWKRGQTGASRPRRSAA